MERTDTTTTTTSTLSIDDELILLLASKKVFNKKDSSIHDFEILFESSEHHSYLFKISSHPRNLIKSAEISETHTIWYLNKLKMENMFRNIIMNCEEYEEYLTYLLENEFTEAFKIFYNEHVPYNIIDKLVAFCVYYGNIEIFELIQQRNFEGKYNINLLGVLSIFPTALLFDNMKSTIHIKYFIDYIHKIYNFEENDTLNLFLSLRKYSLQSTFFALICMNDSYVNVVREITNMCILIPNHIITIVIKSLKYGSTTMGLLALELGNSEKFTDELFINEYELFFNHMCDKNLDCFKLIYEHILSIFEKSDCVDRTKRCLVGFNFYTSQDAGNVNLGFDTQTENYCLFKALNEPLLTKYLLDINPYVVEHSIYSFACLDKFTDETKEICERVLVLFPRLLPFLFVTAIKNSHIDMITYLFDKYSLDNHDKLLFVVMEIFDDYNEEIKNITDNTFLLLFALFPCLKDSIFKGDILCHLFENKCFETIDYIIANFSVFGWKNILLLDLQILICDNDLEPEHINYLLKHVEFDDIYQYIDNKSIKCSDYINHKWWITLTKKYPVIIKTHFIESELVFATYMFDGTPLPSYSSYSSYMMSYQNPYIIENNCWYYNNVFTYDGIDDLILKLIIMTNKTENSIHLVIFLSKIQLLRDSETLKSVHNFVSENSLFIGTCDSNSYTARFNLEYLNSVLAPIINLKEKTTEVNKIISLIVRKIVKSNLCNYFLQKWWARNNVHVDIYTKINCKQEELIDIFVDIILKSDKIFDRIGMIDGVYYDVLMKNRALLDNIDSFQLLIQGKIFYPNIYDLVIKCSEQCLEYVYFIQKYDIHKFTKAQTDILISNNPHKFIKIQMWTEKVYVNNVRTINRMNKNGYNNNNGSIQFKSFVLTHLLCETTISTKHTHVNFEDSLCINNFSLFCFTDGQMEELLTHCDICSYISDGYYYLNIIEQYPQIKMCPFPFEKLIDIPMQFDNSKFIFPYLFSSNDKIVEYFKGENWKSCTFNQPVFNFIVSYLHIINKTLLEDIIHTKKNSTLFLNEVYETEAFDDLSLKASTLKNIMELFNNVQGNYNSLTIDELNHSCFMNVEKTKKVTDNNGFMNFDCSVCSINKNDCVLPCGHPYCYSCANLIQKVNCPSCMKSFDECYELVKELP
jgi:hypothetical protein